MRDISLSIVAPVFNEERDLPELIDRCVAAGRQTGRRFEIILSDDGSRDGSPEIIRRYSERYPGVVIGVMLNRNYGQHAAVMAGLERSSGDIVITLDADLQNPPEEIPRLVAAIETGCDVVGSVRSNRQDTLFRRWSSRLVNKAIQKSTGVMMHDYGCMLRAYRRPIVDAMLQCHERSTFIPILANSFANRTGEIEVRHELRQHGDSKYSFWKLINLQFDLLTSMTTFPLRLLSVFGGGLAVVGFVFGFAMLAMRLIYGASWAAEGVITVIAILFVFVGVQLLSIGIVGEYIGRIYDDVRARPRYFIREVIQATQPSLLREAADARQERVGR